MSDKLFLSPVKPRSTEKHTTLWSLLLVCKQDVSENLIIPQSSSLSKQSQNSALGKNILADAKDLGVPLHSGRRLSPLWIKCNFIWTKLKPSLISLCPHCYLEVCFRVSLLLMSFRFFSRITFLSPSCPATCSFVLWYLILVGPICIWKSYPKNCLACCSGNVYFL